MKKAIVVLLSLLLTLSGCGQTAQTSSSSAPASSSPSASASAPASAPSASASQPTDPAPRKSLDVLKVGVTGFFADGNDPLRGPSTLTAYIYYNVFDFLLYQDFKDGAKLKSYVCDSWEYIDDATIEFKLKDGITFHNGDPLTTEDVKFSFDRREATGSKSSYLNLFKNITEIQIVDKLTFRIIMDGSDPSMLRKLASRFGVAITPKGYYEEVGDEKYNDLPIGTGPYKFESLSPDKFVLTYYEGYYGERPVADRIEYLAYPENAARVTALLNGEIDMAFALAPDLESVITNSPDHWINYSLSFSTQQLQVNTANPPLNDKKLRQALNISIDRQLLCDTLWNGNAFVMNGPYNFPEYGDYYVEDWPLPEFNPEKAKQLVDESSYNGEEIVMVIRPNNYYTNGQAAAEAISAMWSAIGVNVKLVSDQTSWDEAFSGSDPSMRNIGGSMQFLDPSGGLANQWTSSGFKASWQDMPQEFMDLKAIVNNSSDVTERLDAIKRMMEIFEEEAPGIILYRTKDMIALRNGIIWERFPDIVGSFRAGDFDIE